MTREPVDAEAITDDVLDHARAHAALHHESAEIIGDLIDTVTMWRDFAVAIASERRSSFATALALERKAP